MSNNNIVILHQSDNIAIAISDIKKDGTATLGSLAIQASSEILFGHKIALTTIEIGKPIIKYGVTIGIATVAIRKGDHVHVHNIKSLYTKQFTK